MFLTYSYTHTCDVWCEWFNLFDTNACRTHISNESWKCAWFGQGMQFLHFRSNILKLNLEISSFSHLHIIFFFSTFFSSHICSLESGHSHFILSSIKWAAFTNSLQKFSFNHKFVKTKTPTIMPCAFCTAVQTL